MLAIPASLSADNTISQHDGLILNGDGVAVQAQTVATGTPTPTPSATSTATPTSTPTPSATPTASATSTATPTSTPTPSATPTASATATATATATPTSTPANFAEDTTSGLPNPYRGIQTTGGGEPSKAKQDVDMAGIPAGEINYRRHWAALEPTEGTYDFTSLVTLFTKARANNQSVNLRLVEFEPSSSSTFECPSYVASQDGYYTVSQSGLPNAKICNWANSNTRDRVNTFLTALASYDNSSTWQSGFKNHPALGAIDIPLWGDFGEANWADWTYVSKTTGSVVNGGQEIPPADAGAINKPSDAAQDDIVDHYTTQFDNNFFVNTIGYQDNGGQQYAMLTKLTGWRGDCLGFRESTAACPETGGNQMCGLYPHELGYSANSISGAGALPLSLNGAAILETCFDLDYWKSTGLAAPKDKFDIAQNFTWLGQVGASAVSIKSKYATYAGLTNAFVVEKALGYRLYLSSVSNVRNVAAGSNLSVSSNWYNRGYAPFYAKNHYLMFKLVNQAGGDVLKYVSTNQPNGILPTSSPKTFTDSIAIPSWLDAGAYDVYIGIGYNNTSARSQDLRRPDIALANTGQAADGTLWYKSDDVVTVTNASPSANPTVDYAASFASASSQGLNISANTVALYPRNSAGTGDSDFEIAIWANMTSKGAIRPFINLGPLSSKDQAFWVGYDSSNDRYKATISNGTSGTIYTVSDTNFGSPATSHWDCLLVRYDHTNHTLSIRTDLGTAVTSATTGSIQLGSRAFRLGNDSDSNFMNGGLYKPYYWKRLLSGAEETSTCQTHGLPLEDMPWSMTDKLYFAPTLNEATGTRADGFQHWILQDANGVTRTTAP